MRQKDLKLLWGRSASRCALCKIELAYDEASSNTSIPIGEQAHIVAEEGDGPRGKSILTLEQRNAYANIILLCPTCHATVDKATADYPVERLYVLKTEHELWVRESLSGPDSEEPGRIIYAHLVDAAVELANLRQWNQWASAAIQVDPRWPAVFRETGFELQSHIHLAIWPGTNAELELSLRSFVEFLSASFAVFAEHCKFGGEMYLVASRFYHQNHDKGRFQQRLEAFNAWTTAYSELLREANRSANWLSNVVRRDMNKTFFLREGKFALTEGMFTDWSYRCCLYEYDDRTRPTSMSEVERRIEELTADYRAQWRAVREADSCGAK